MLMSASGSVTIGQGPSSHPLPGPGTGDSVTLTLWNSGKTRQQKLALVEGT